MDINPTDFSEKVRVRFAPSPTGDLHAGGLRTALFNFLLRNRLGGSLVFRLEDTDFNREVSGAVDRLLNDFDWAGIRFDEGIREGGSFSSYRQSERRIFHIKAAKN